MMRELTELIESLEHDKLKTTTTSPHIIFRWLAGFCPPEPLRRDDMLVARYPRWTDERREVEGSIKHSEREIII